MSLKLGALQRRVAVRIVQLAGGTVNEEDQPDVARLTAGFQKLLYIIGSVSVSWNF